MNKILTILVVLLSLGCVYSFSKLKKEQSIHKQNIVALNSHMELYKDKLNRSVAEKKALVVQVNDLKSFGDSLQVAIKNIKPQVVVQIKERIVYKDSIIVKWKDPETKSFEWSNKWAFFNGQSFDQGVRIDSFGFNDDITLVQGLKRDWFLGRRYSVVRVVHSNPYVQTQNVRPLIVRPKERFYEKWYFQLGAGFLCGYLLK